uniref:Uncharacterized protein n=1 Tax=Chromera velia CCMP2878 TaxID=1169474 RepID=A0A0G4IFG0_9ALVE|eukprot:Cvel_13884.t1-p1 / transcript=Cvel_13884.t1 / gene=Cvel_13884 / organism=Chromera_velia_CCMP2878 / gene_product=hypothetical protein / transcript_product=hypothetical protein / location=Cvel_scaffold966:52246-54769(-) / protein_length=509 / sequence_SO=supercontig / SO=protein_coding / is_pseudo=false
MSIQKESKVVWSTERPPSRSDYKQVQSYAKVLRVWVNSIASVSGLTNVGPSLFILCLVVDPSLCFLVEKILADDSKKAPEKTSTNAAHLAALRKWALDTFVETIESVDKKIDKDQEFELLADAIWFFSLCVSKFGLSLREALNAFTSLNEVASSDRVGLKFSDRLLGIRFWKCILEDIKKLAPSWGTKTVVVADGAVLVKSSFKFQTEFVGEILSRFDSIDRINRNAWIPSVSFGVLSVSNGTATKTFTILSSPVPSSLPQGLEAAIAETACLLSESTDFHNLQEETVAKLEHFTQKYREAVAETYMKMAEKEKPSSTKGSAQWQTKKKQQQQQRVRHASTEDEDDEDEDEEAEGDASGEIGGSNFDKEAFMARFSHCIEMGERDEDRFDTSYERLRMAHVVTESCRVLMENGFGEEAVVRLEGNLTDHPGAKHVLLATPMICRLSGLAALVSAGREIVWAKLQRASPSAEFPFTTIVTAQRVSPSIERVAAAPTRQGPNRKGHCETSV